MANLYEEQEMNIFIATFTAEIEKCTDIAGAESKAKRAVKIFHENFPKNTYLKKKKPLGFLYVQNSSELGRYNFQLPKCVSGFVTDMTTYVAMLDVSDKRNMSLLSLDHKTFVDNYGIKTILHSDQGWLFCYTEWEEIDKITFSHNLPFIEMIKPYPGINNSGLTEEDCTDLFNKYATSRAKLLGGD